MRNARIHRAVCTDGPSIKDPKMHDARIYRTVDTNRCGQMMMNDGDDDDARPLSCRMSESIELLTQIAAEMKTPRCGMPESIELYAQIGPASKTRKCTMSESTELLTQIDGADDEDARPLSCKMSESIDCLLYTSPSPRDRQKSRMPSSA